MRAHGRVAFIFTAFARNDVSYGWKHQASRVFIINIGTVLALFTVILDIEIFPAHRRHSRRRIVQCIMVYKYMHTVHFPKEKIFWKQYQVHSNIGVDDDARRFHHIDVLCIDESEVWFVDANRRMQIRGWKNRHCPRCWCINFLLWRARPSGCFCFPIGKSRFDHGFAEKRRS